MAAVASGLLLELRFDRGRVETFFDEGLSPATVQISARGKQPTRVLPEPVHIRGLEELNVHQLDFGDNQEENRLAVPALPITNCDFTVAAWVKLPCSLRNHRIFLLSNWVSCWSYFLGLRIDSEGRVATIGELRRNINSHGSDPQQGLVGVDSAQDTSHTAGNHAFPWATGMVSPVTSPPVRGQGRVGELMHVAWTWQRKEGRFSAWINGACVASQVTPWDERDVQANRSTTHDVGYKRDGGPCWMKGGLLQLQATNTAEVQPGAMNGLMKAVLGRLNFQRRRLVLLCKVCTRSSTRAM